MEIKPTQVLVRDLDLTLQPRTSPRYKFWLPLATQQLRLRNLCQIIGYNLETDKKFETCWFYFTIHRSSMSSPFYTSEPIDNVSPRWSSLEVPTLHATGLSTANEIVLRLWRRTKVDDPSTDIAIFTWGISFTGLVYMGPKLSNNLESMLLRNSLIFHLHGGFFVPSYCLQHSPEFRRYLKMSVSNSEICQSYTVNQLIKLRNQMKYMKQKHDNVQVLREKIASGCYEQSPKYKQTTLNKLLQPQKISKEKKAEILKIKNQLEIAKFRKKLLEQERIRKVSKLRKLSKLHLSMMEDNQDNGSLLMERYRELNKDIERLREWRQNHIESRELYVQTSAQLAYHRRKLMADICVIYPIRQEKEGIFTICNVHLPDSEELNTTKNDIRISVGLGYVSQTTEIIGKILNIPIRYPIINNGSHCKIIDHITNNIPDKERQFPLFSRNKDKLRFHYGVYLLNKNIAQLRWYCGLPTTDLRCTLSNLASLLHLKPSQTLDNTKRTFSGSSLDTDSSNNNGKNNIPLTPPLQKLLLDKMNITGRTMSQIKNSKTTLGSSLDQGLDKPMNIIKFHQNIKRICKSEESAIDDKILSLPRDRISNSSYENFHTCAFDKNKTEKNVLNKLKTSASSTSSLSSSEILDTEIEISIPLSVTKINSEDSSYCQRSSTSISSCEIALNCSQNDVVDCSNSNIISDTTELPVTNTQIEEESVQSSGGSSSTISIYEKNDYKKSQETLKDENISDKKIQVINSTDTHSHSFSSLDKISNSSNTIDDQFDVASSCPESAKSFYDDSDDCLSLNNWRTESVSSLQTTSHDIVVDTSKKINNVTLSQSQPNNVQEAVSNYHASTKLIDSIRRSSENVFARTEALASKKTSFKVMKPRL